MAGMCYTIYKIRGNGNYEIKDEVINCISGHDICSDDPDMRCVLADRYIDQRAADTVFYGSRGISLFQGSDRAGFSHFHGDSHCDHSHIYGVDPEFLDLFQRV